MQHCDSIESDINRIPWDKEESYKRAVAEAAILLIFFQHFLEFIMSDIWGEEADKPHPHVVKDNPAPDKDG